jgi:hypothetical protein
MDNLGYVGILKLIQGAECGAPLWEEYFVTIYRRKDVHSGESLMGPIGTGLAPRGCSNCLKPAGIPRRVWTSSEVEPWGSKSTYTNCLGGVNGRPVFEDTGPMLASADALVSTMNGVRSLLPEEWLSLKGLPSNWGLSRLGLSKVLSAPSVHVWAAIGDFIQGLPCAGRSAPISAPTGLTDSTDTNINNIQSTQQDPEGPTDRIDPDEWTWSPPDLCEGGDWYKERVQTLKDAVAECHGPHQWILDGMETLAKHRLNYTDKGPQHLVILWWEWPREHWMAL